MELSHLEFRNKHCRQPVRRMLRSQKCVQGCVWVGGWKGTSPLTGSRLFLSLSSCCSYCFYQDTFLAQMQKLEPQGWSVSHPLYKQTLDSLWLGSNSPGPSEGADSSPPGSLPACRQGKGRCLLWGSSFWGFCHRHRMVTLIEGKNQIGIVTNTFQGCLSSFTGKTFLLDFPVYVP